VFLSALILSIAASLAAILPAGAGAAEARAVVDTSVVMYTDGDFLADEEPHRVWRTGAGEVQAAGTLASGRIEVTTSGGSSGDDFTFSFTAPLGEPLAVGRYDDARASKAADTAGIAIAGDGRSCNPEEVRGSFEILQAAPDLSTLWMTYEQHCNGGPRSIFGEIRVGQAGDRDVSLLAGRVDWPTREVAGHGAVVPVDILNTSSRTTSVTAPVLDGDDFSLEGTDCGPTLRAGASCAVLVGFTPLSRGLRRGTLTVTLSDGPHQVPLTGRGAGGDTVWHMVGEPGDFIGAGRTWDFDVADRVFAVADGDSVVRMKVGSQWAAEFTAPDGAPLVPGTYDGTTSSSSPEPGQPRMNVHGNGRGCDSVGSFTVLEARRDARGNLIAARIRFDQSCDGRGTFLRGEIAWHATSSDEPLYPEVTPPAPTPTVRLDVPRTTYDYGQLIALDVATTGAAGHKVTVYRAQWERTPQPIRTGTIGPDGRFVTTVRALASARFLAVVDGVSSAPVAVTVRSLVTQRVVARYRREGVYYRVRATRGADVLASVTPNPGATGCFVFQTSVRLRSGWSGWSKPTQSPCVGGNNLEQPQGPGVLTLTGKALTGKRVRVRSTFRPDGGSATGVGTSAFSYLHFVK
jgi:hypothetical protein